MSPITSSITFTPQFANLSQTINRVAPILDGQMKLVCGSYETMTNHSGFVGYLVDGRTSYYLNQLEGLEVSDCLVPTGQSDFALVAVRTFAGQPYLLDPLQQATVMQNDQAMVVMLPLDSNFFITPTTLPVAQSVISVATNRLYDWSLGSFVWQQCYTTELMSCDFTIYDTSDLAPGYSLKITAQSSATMQVSNVLNFDGQGLALMFVTLGSESESASLTLVSANCGDCGQQRKTIQLLAMQTMLVLVYTTSNQPAPMIQFVRRTGWRALLCSALLCSAHSPHCIGERRSYCGFATRHQAPPYPCIRRQVLASGSSLRGHHAIGHRSTVSHRARYHQSQPTAVRDCHLGTARWHDANQLSQCDLDSRWRSPAAGAGYEQCRADG